MRLLLVFALLFSSTAGAVDVVVAPAQLRVKPRLFFAPVAAGAAADPAVVAVIEDRILTSARRHPQFEVVAARDVQSLLELEATRQQSGCDDGGVACAAELAGALDAPQLVTGTLGRVGNTWVLSLTRMERGSLTVLARVSRETVGDTPEGFLRDIDGIVDDLFGVAVDGAASGGGGFPVVPVIGSVVGAVGVVGVVVGVIAGAQSWAVFDTAKQRLINEPGLDDAAQQQIRDDARTDGEFKNLIATIGVIGGGALVVVGAGVVVLGLQGGE